VKGDFPDFYRQHFGELAGYAWSLTRDASVGDDLAQEAMVRVYARWPVLSDPRPYAYRIVMNLARDRWRGQARELAHRSYDAGALTTPGPDTSTYDAVLRLPPDLRDVVALHYYADLPLAEIAKVLRRPLGTVKRRLHDARAALAVALAEEVR
jgi:RNA polymerase sigma-70 factor (ECF subfamily)